MTSFDDIYICHMYHFKDGKHSLDINCKLHAKIKIRTLTLSTGEAQGCKVSLQLPSMNNFCMYPTQTNCDDFEELSSWKNKVLTETRRRYPDMLSAYWRQYPDI